MPETIGEKKRGGFWWDLINTGIALGVLMVMLYANHSSRKYIDKAIEKVVTPNFVINKEMSLSSNSNLFIANLDSPQFTKSCNEYFKQVQNICEDIGEKYSKAHEAAEISNQELRKAILTNNKFKDLAKKFSSKIGKPKVIIGIEITNQNPVFIPINEMHLELEHPTYHIWQEKGSICQVNEKNGKREYKGTKFLLDPSTIMKLEISFVSNAFEDAPMQQPWILESFQTFHKHLLKKYLVITYLGNKTEKIDLSKNEIHIVNLP